MHTAGGGGDVLDLQSASTSGSGTGNISVEIRLYNTGIREGEIWYDESFTLTYQNDAIAPGVNADNYQMKWDLLSGDPPSGAGTSSADGVWYALSSGDFRVQWTALSGGNTESGVVTVSLRLGAGPSVLATAEWDGDAVSEKKGQ